MRNTVLSMLKDALPVITLFLVTVLLAILMCLGIAEVHVGTIICLTLLVIANVLSIAIIVLFLFGHKD